MLAAGDVATADAHHRGCHTKACVKRVQIAQAGYPFCNTWKCVRRVARKREARWRFDNANLINAFEAIARCESGGNWSINTGNGYYGGIQFSLRSWRAVGGVGYPHQNSKWEQIRRGIRLLAVQGWGAWPACSRKLGFR